MRNTLAMALSLPLAHSYYKGEELMTRCRSVRVCGLKFKSGGLLSLSDNYFKFLFFYLPPDIFFI